MSTQTIIGLVIEGKYRLEQKIGEGGMGAVYLGTQLMVDRKVAIKLLHAGLNGHDKLKKRFEVEAKAIGRLHHPNCITLFDFGFSRELEAFFTVMEYLDGEAMHKRVVYGVAADEAMRVTRQIAMALDHAHHQGILHRDLKPENIILAKMTDGSELVKVLDFGIARIFQSGDEDQPPQQQNRLTQAGEVFGTPAYISPEQARGERDLTPASDLYSLGVMLFEMLEGRLPFWGDTAIDTIMKHITEPVPAITRIDVPDALRQICYKLLEKDPKRRFQSGKELVDELVVLERTSLTPRAPAPTPGMASNFGATPAPPSHTIRTGPPSNLNQDVHRPHHLADTNPDEWEDAGATVVDASGSYARPFSVDTPQHTTHNTLTNFAPPPPQNPAHSNNNTTKITIAIMVCLFLCACGVAVAFFLSGTTPEEPVITTKDKTQPTKAHVSTKPPQPKEVEKPSVEPVKPPVDPPKVETPEPPTKEPEARPKKPTKKRVVKKRPGKVEPKKEPAKKTTPEKFAPIKPKKPSEPKKLDLSSSRKLKKLGL